MRCNNGKIRVCQENEGSKFRIYKYVLVGWIRELFSDSLWPKKGEMS